MPDECRKKLNMKMNFEEDSIPHSQSGGCKTETDVVDRRGYSEDRCCTSMSLYLREVGRVKLLTREEEVELAARIKKGDQEAREQMIKANLRLVVKIARSYEGIGVPLLDLISEGNIGLMKAVERFDPSKGAKLSAYSAWWIRQAITRALASQSKAMRLPTHVVDKLAKLRRAALQMEEELGREPTDEELAEEVGTTSARVTQMRMAAIRPASLDAQLDGDDIRSFGETVADEKAESPYEKLEGKTFGVMLWNTIKTLDRREQRILGLRFGLDGEPAKTLEEAGEELGLSRERVRQIETAALMKLRRRIMNLENNLPLNGSRASEPVRALSSVSRW
jgi:RNA polymerase primary sigma factor